MRKAENEADWLACVREAAPDLEHAGYREDKTTHERDAHYGDGAFERRVYATGHREVSRGSTEPVWLLSCNHVYVEDDFARIPQWTLPKAGRKVYCRHCRDEADGLAKEEADEMARRQAESTRLEAERTRLEAEHAKREAEKARQREMLENAALAEAGLLYPRESARKAILELTKARYGAQVRMTSVSARKRKGP